MSASLNELFLAACKSLNIEKMSACLTLKVDINTVDSAKGMTGLMKCVRKPGSQEGDRSVELLLQQPGLDINKQENAKQCTALHLASYINNHIAVARLCVMPGIHLNILDIQGITPLHYAVWKGHIESVRALNVNGIDWNLKSGGDSAVMIAVKNGRTEIFKYLIEISDVDLNTRDGQNKTLKAVARENNKHEILCAMSRAVGNFPVEWNRRVPECPVCYVEFARDTPMFQCGQGHIVCGNCRPRIQICPKCRGQMTGRAHDFEQFLRDSV
eukprot:TRINITY_DN12736_c0_g1_i2.p1 TRINITY_DN12736_c0_g1~~TRINITY_DN12736_c0_g1_i2.p1  ORF type:complete len:271 (+),score=64.35 TRINITY_DN12736_c0_g1_i2:46-858(+)